MIYWKKPTAETIDTYLLAQSEQELTYSEVGGTLGELPTGYKIGHTRMELGVGETTYQAARQALTDWRQFDVPWVELWRPGTPIEEGAVVGVLGRAIGLWWLNACKIVGVVDSDGPVARFGLAYGTLPDHVAFGEEHFLVEWDKQTDVVWYDVLAFSRPRGFLAHVGAPYLRWTQSCFRRESGLALRAALGSLSSVSG